MKDLSKYILFSVIIICILIVISSDSLATNFKVSPVKIFFDTNEKTSVLRIKNMGGEKATIQIHAKKWRQDQDGEDKYEDTNEIVIFPKIVTIEKDKERIIRLGYQGRKILDVEETYRLFVEEVPVTKPGEQVLKFVLKMNIPVFILPVKKKTERSIEKIEIRDRNLIVKIRNAGNTHFIVSKIKARGINSSGNEVFSKEKTGWYILSGASKTYAIEISKEECKKTSSIKVGVEADGKVMESELNIDSTMCQHKK